MCVYIAYIYVYVYSIHVCVHTAYTLKQHEYNPLLHITGQQLPMLDVRTVPLTCEQSTSSSKAFVR